MDKPLTTVEFINYIATLPKEVKPLSKKVGMFGCPLKMFSRYNPHGILILWPRYLTFLTNGKTAWSPEFALRMTGNNLGDELFELAYKAFKMRGIRNPKKYVNMLVHPASYVIPVREIISFENFKKKAHKLQPLPNEGLLIKSRDAMGNVEEYYLASSEGTWFSSWRDELRAAIDKAKQW